ncbi:hypothetical protein CC85DRAFT_326247 [Cutaneotrichosporon oleaginosum]|uniref:BTB domain-containing protein n=1 Tax=Cutaneotrichosporon oleaginosum TaxID=879819 RepID=A0A0J1B9Y7_9TREE|nr:uncharacterized protein CC85DRAFT_326247 [Cutaneotrichosporon oleaginosum]KLT44669.1 hypothetical protein CC85DRAFT_326247 [Cutaneotrichosporon oleaginosum]TXT07656.1 hypothetical protein COLE_04580 [Cutaneotrichosporon oleaginosum]
MKTSRQPTFQELLVVPETANRNHVALHPDFNENGDVLIVCTEGEQQVGFLVNGSMMRMASPVLTELLGPPEPGPPKILRVDDSVHDMHAFLRLLRFAAPSSGFPPPFDPNISQYAGIHRLALKYNGWYPRAVLDFHVELHAAQIVDDLGPDATKQDVFSLLRLAHALHSSYLWSQVCDRLRFNKWWHGILNPWQFSEEDAAALGPSIHSILSILASVSSRTRLYSNLEELCVLYTDEGEVSVAAAERPSGACPCGATRFA